MLPAFVGEWRSLVAHSTGGRKVGGSNPLSPTKFTRTYPLSLHQPITCVQSHTIPGREFPNATQVAEKRPYRFTTIPTCSYRFIPHSRSPLRHAQRRSRSGDGRVGRPDRRRTWHRSVGLAPPIDLNATCNTRKNILIITICVHLWTGLVPVKWRLPSVKV
jgi:hypothetical protein